MKIKKNGKFLGELGETKTIKKFREDGSLMYEAAISFIKSHEGWFPKRIQMEDGNEFIYGDSTKYRKDGSIEWRMIRDEFGNLITVERDPLTHFEPQLKLKI